MARGDVEADSQIETQGLLASARALVAELAEEGVCEFERLGLPDTTFATPASQRVPDVAPRAALRETPVASAESAVSQASRQRRAEPGGTSTNRAADGAAPVGVAEAVPWAGRRPTLDEVRTHLGDCERCGLCGDRRTIVFGDGNPNADLMFIGEGPGEQEDRQGLPFVGRAGELLTQMIEKGLGIPRRDVYICNIVKCRPPQNRNPLPPEVSACRPFLDGQIQAIAPKVIITLGKPAASLLLDRDVAITRMRGTWHDYRGIPLMPTLHPAYVLRQYTEENRRAVWQDLKVAVERSQAS